jgi:hypothetical protein
LSFASARNVPDASSALPATAIAEMRRLLFLSVRSNDVTAD